MVKHLLAQVIADAFAKHLAGYLGDQGWETYGDVVVRFEQADNLHTGQYRARAVVNPDAAPGARPDPGRRLTPRCAAKRRGNVGGEGAGGPVEGPPAPRGGAAPERGARNPNARGG